MSNQMFRQRNTRLDNFPVERDLFSTVGHLGMRRHAEDQLTNIFQACFSHSPVFQRTVLEKLWKLCGLGRRRPTVMKWNCSTQMFDQDSRYDIYISPEHGSSRRGRTPSFVIESKVDAPLTESQLGKYERRNKKSRDHCIAVITKEHPDVPQSWLKDHKVAALRWQDLYLALHHVSAKGDQVNKFLITQFLQYLSRANMAYESVSLTDLQHFARLLSAISKGRRDGVVNRGRKAFTTGDAVLRLLKEVQVTSTEYLRHPNGFTVWGPGYDRYEIDGTWHSLCFSFYRNSRSINCGVTISDDADEIYLEIYYWDDKKNSYHKEPNCCEPLPRFLTNGVLDKDKIARQCKSLFQKWGVAKVKKVHL